MLFLSFFSLSFSPSLLLSSPLLRLVGRPAAAALAHARAPVSSHRRRQRRKGGWLSASWRKNGKAHSNGRPPVLLLPAVSFAPQRSPLAVSAASPLRRKRRRSKAAWRRTRRDLQQGLSLSLFAPPFSSERFLLLLQPFSLWRPVRVCVCLCVCVCVSHGAPQNRCGGQRRKQSGKGNGSVEETENPFLPSNWSLSRARAWFSSTGTVVTLPSAHRKRAQREKREREREKRKGQTQAARKKRERGASSRPRVRHAAREQRRIARAKE